MDLELGPDDIAFRDEVRAFTAANVTPAMRRAHDLTTSFIDDPHEAIEFHVDGLRQEGYPIPEPQTTSSYVELPV